MGPYDRVKGADDAAVTEARCRRETSGIEIVGILVGLTMFCHPAGGCAVVETAAYRSSTSPRSE